MEVRGSSARIYRKEPRRSGEPVVSVLDRFCDTPPAEESFHFAVGTRLAEVEWRRQG
jgi:hypothetical protein